MKNRFELRSFGKQLWTREKAKEIRKALFDKLQKINSGEAMVIDATDIDVFDYSFANELFGKTVLSLPVDCPDKFVLVEHLNDYTRENLEKALEGMGLAMIERRGNKLVLLGKANPIDQGTFAAIAGARAPVAATTLKDKLGLNLTTVNERLTKLFDLRVVRRDRGASAAGREQYLYSVPA